MIPAGRIDGAALVVPFLSLTVECKSLLTEAEGEGTGLKDETSTVSKTEENAVNVLSLFLREKLVKEI